MPLSYGGVEGGHPPRGTRQLFFSMPVNVHMQNWSKLQCNATPYELRVEIRRLCAPTLSLHFPTVLRRGSCVGQGWRFKGDEIFAATVLKLQVQSQRSS